MCSFVKVNLAEFTEYIPFSFQPPVTINKNKLLQKLESEHNAIKNINAAKLNKMKDKLIE